MGNVVLVEEFDEEIIGKEINLKNDDGVCAKSTIKQAYQNKRARNRTTKKKKMAPSWLGGALHSSPPPSETVISYLLCPLL